MIKTCTKYSIGTATNISILLVLFTSCFRKQTEKLIDYTGFLEKHLVFVGSKKPGHTFTDTLCSITLNIPARLDTFYTWEDRSDYDDARYVKYRFADTNYDQYAESGFYYAFHPDSVYQLTVCHKRYQQVPDSIILNPLGQNEKDHEWF